jgi:hypothetical protein
VKNSIGGRWRLQIEQMLAVVLKVVVGQCRDCGGIKVEHGVRLSDRHQIELRSGLRVPLDTRAHLSRDRRS